MGRVTRSPPPRAFNPIPHLPPRLALLEYEACTHHVVALVGITPAIGDPFRVRFEVFPHQRRVDVAEAAYDPPLTDEQQELLVIWGLRIAGALTTAGRVFWTKYAGPN
jgi:hypothetical protein